MKRPFRALRRTLGLLLVPVVLAAALFGGVLLANGQRMYHKAVQQLPVEQAAAQLRARDDFTPLSQLPAVYLDAVVAVEDHRFYRHPGLDPLSMARAVWVNLSSRSLAQGGSTITQQLAKNLYFSHEKTFERKIAEVFAVAALERTLTKDEILELYVNTIYFGAGCYSVGAAAQHFFGVPPAQLTAGQCVLLAGLPHAPSAYDPTDGDTAAALQRQKQVLRRMVETGALTQAEADAIAAEEVFAQ